MFKLFSRSSSRLPDYSFIGTDMHSHLLPGIDDGSPNLETSISLIRGLSALGYTKLITTPHVMWEMYRNSRETILQKLDLLRERVQQENIPVEIHAAAEYFLDEHVSGMMKRGEPLLTLGGKMVLVEFSLAHAPFDLKDILFELQMQGYQPVIAHPERYIYLEHKKDFYEELRDIGCLFQLNLLSLGNNYGKSVQEIAAYLLKKGYYDLAGTDLHHGRHLDALQQAAMGTALQKLQAANVFRNKQLL